MRNEEKKDKVTKVMRQKKCRGGEENRGSETLGPGI